MELPGPVAFFDGECNICDRSVRYLLHRDVRHELHYASLQGTTADELRAARADVPRDIDTFVLAEPAPGEPAGLRVVLRTDGLLRALDLTGGRPLWARLLAAVPRPVRDLGYRAFVAQRYRLFGRKDVCELPTAEERATLLP
jgi:predicted DCC family thiol-disulfide oxidoreductase YuxK